MKTGWVKCLMFIHRRTKASRPNVQANNGTLNTHCGRYCSAWEASLQPPQLLLGWIPSANICLTRDFLLLTVFAFTFTTTFFRYHYTLQHPILSDRVSLSIYYYISSSTSITKVHFNKKPYFQTPNKKISDASYFLIKQIKTAALYFKL